jgi:hypothetical protein
MVVFWDAAPCRLADINHHHPDDAGSKLLWKVCQYLPGYTVLIPQDSHIILAFVLKKSGISQITTVQNINAWQKMVTWGVDFHWWQISSINFAPNNVMYALGALPLSLLSPTPPCAPSPPPLISGI